MHVTWSLFLLLPPAFPAERVLTNTCFQIRSLNNLHGSQLIRRIIKICFLVYVSDRHELRSIITWKLLFIILSIRKQQSRPYVECTIIRTCTRKTPFLKYRYTYISCVSATWHPGVTPDTRHQLCLVKGHSAAIPFSGQIKFKVQYMHVCIFPKHDDQTPDSTFSHYSSARRSDGTLSPFPSDMQMAWRWQTDGLREVTGRRCPCDKKRPILGFLAGT